MILFKLKKKWAKNNIIFEENSDMLSQDKWFIDVKFINKSGIIKECHTIIKKDVNMWLNSYLKDGWKTF